MNDVLERQILAALWNLINNISPLNRFVIFDIFFKIPSFAVFRDYVAVITGKLKINEFHDVWMLNLLHDFYFILKHVNIGNVHLLHAYDFYGIPHLLDVILDSLVDNAAKATSDHIL